MKSLIHIWATIERLQCLWLEKDRLKGHRGSIIAVKSKCVPKTPRHHSTPSTASRHLCYLLSCHVLTHSALCLNVVRQLLWAPDIIDLGFMNCAPRPCPERHDIFCHVVPGGFASTMMGQLFNSMLAHLSLLATISTHSAWQNTFSFCCWIEQRESRSH